MLSMVQRHCAEYMGGDYMAKEPSIEELEKQLREKKAEARKGKKRKKLGFTKIVLIVILVLSVRWIELTYRLAMAGKEQTAEQLSIAIVTLVLGSFVTVALKRFGEKNSLNKYGKEREVFEDEL